MISNGMVLILLSVGEPAKQFINEVSSPSLQGSRIQVNPMDLEVEQFTDIMS